MRKMLFRGKRKDNGEWIMSSDICQPDYDEVYLWAHGNWTEVYSETVGQYTGLSDKNGKEIFEGDIVKGNDTSEKSVKVCGYIDFMNGSYVVVGDLITHYRWIDYKLEVIGNIHDTPELLGAEG